MRVVVAGLGNQGRKRLTVAHSDVVATIDPVNTDADYRDIAAVPVELYDAALVCTPNDAKMAILSHLLANRKHVLVEKPLLATDATAIEKLYRLAETNGTVCYTAYNHRFEPHFVRMRDLIAKGELGRIYLCRMFYGNGTARDVRNSPWRDKDPGVLADLGSHLLDTALFWFGSLLEPCTLTGANRFENRALDHVAFRSSGEPVLEMEATLVSWRNDFTADVYGERGSAHIRSLCKWGSAVFIQRQRVLPSGRPPESSHSLIQADPTWEVEYNHFEMLCRNGHSGNLANDLILNRILSDLAHQLAPGLRMERT